MNKKYKYLGKNTIIFAISSFGTKILSFLLVPLYTSVLTTEEYVEYKKMKRDLSCIKSKVDYLSKEFPINSTMVGLIEMLKDY